MKASMRFLAVIIIVVIATGLITARVLASTYSASNQWVDVTCYPEVTCIPYSFRHSASAEVSVERTGSNSWKAWNHSHYGSIYMQSTFCGYSDWLRLSSYWEDSTGQKTISSWTSQAWICPTNYSCGRYFSSQTVNLVPDPLRGKYRSATDFGSDCIPRSSGTHTLTIAP